jgi:cytochrome c-type biogenesis protein CcmE
MSRKAWAVVAISLAGAALLYIAFGGLGQNLVYYWTPSEMMAQHDKALGATIRLGGMVEVGSVKPEGTTLNFRVTDGATTVPVQSTGVPPQMFREGIGVVVEGTLQPSGTFSCTRLMVKHGNEYRAPKDGETPDKKAMFGTLDEG